MYKKTILDNMDSHIDYLTNLVMLYSSRSNELLINDDDLLVFIKNCASLVSMIRDFQDNILEEFD